MTAVHLTVSGGSTEDGFEWCVRASSYPAHPRPFAGRRCFVSRVRLIVTKWNTASAGRTRSGRLDGPSGGATRPGGGTSITERLTTPPPAVR